MNDWLREQSMRSGWFPVDSALEAQQLANLGFIVVASWKNPEKRPDGTQRSGHIVMVRPHAWTAGFDAVNGPQITQAGSSNLSSAALSRGFPRKVIPAVRFFARNRPAEGPVWVLKPGFPVRNPERKQLSSEIGVRGKGNWYLMEWTLGESAGKRHTRHEFDGKLAWDWVFEFKVGGIVPQEIYPGDKFQLVLTGSVTGEKLEGIQRTYGNIAVEGFTVTFPKRGQTGTVTLGNVDGKMILKEECTYQYEIPAGYRGRLALKPFIQGATIVSYEWEQKK
jgi:hypothetical protein